jgi:dTDP-3-amino-2,3,6-trideoxy-4-keto-D-glucose/dTDP-3-amino-3,4,6-trideoxy-alpha-D-glucose/dTDP-2,6-dideoxy-D-kanosamine transaminase
LQQINNLSKHIKNHEKIIKNALNRVLDSGWLVLGPEVSEFERSFSEYIGTSYCVSVANGTDAIELALRSFNLKSGDQVATIANAGMYSTTAILAVDAKPYFMDVDIGTKLVTLVDVEKAIAAGAKAVILTHLYGLAIPESEAISDLCNKRGVFVLEDCAQAHGAKINGKKVGSFGDIASFSFYPTKNLGAIGDGGAIVTNSECLAIAVRALRQYGWESKYNTVFKGGCNSRLDELQAAVLREFLPWLDRWNARRREIATLYSNKIVHPEISLPPRISGEDYVGHLYVVTSIYRDSLSMYLRAVHIGTDIHYPTPDHRQKVFKGKYATLNLHNTERLSNEVLTLPCYPEMEDSDVEMIAEAVNKWTP